MKTQTSNPFTPVWTPSTELLCTRLSAIPYTSNVIAIEGKRASGLTTALKLIAEKHSHILYHDCVPTSSFVQASKQLPKSIHYYGLDKATERACDPIELTTWKMKQMQQYVLLLGSIEMLKGQALGVIEKLIESCRNEGHPLLIALCSTQMENFIAGEGNRLQAHQPDIIHFSPPSIPTIQVLWNEWGEPFKKFHENFEVMKTVESHTGGNFYEILALSEAILNASQKKPVTSADIHEIIRSRKNRQPIVISDAEADEKSLQLFRKIFPNTLQKMLPKFLKKRIFPRFFQSHF